jgi:transcriptional regulator with XRE-family HTH domain
MKLRAYLKKHNLTYQEFADLIGVRKMTVWHWATDGPHRKTPRPKHLKRIIEATKGKVTYSDFFAD